MYHIVKPITEWRRHDCNPRVGVKPIDRDRMTNEPMFDYHDVEPRSNRGAEYLDRCYREANRAESHERENHGADALRYSFNPDHVMNFRDVQIEMPNWQENKNMSTQHMNETQSLAVALLDNFTTVDCNSPRTGRELTFKKPKELYLEEGDMVVCSFHDKGFDVLEVKEVHDGIQNPDDIKLAWIAGKVDIEKLTHLQDLDQKAVDKIKQMQQNKARKELLAEFSEDELKTLGNDLEIKKLT